MITVKELNLKLKETEYDLDNLSEEECDLLYDVNRIRSGIGKIVRHFKGKFYLLLDIVEHTETGEELVIYKAMYDDYKKYARPIDMFISKVDKIKYPEAEQEYRFELVELVEAK